MDNICSLDLLAEQLKGSLLGLESAVQANDFASLTKSNSNLMGWSIILEALVQRLTRLDQPTAARLGRRTSNTKLGLGVLIHEVPWSAGFVLIAPRLDGGRHPQATLRRNRCESGWEGVR